MIDDINQKDRAYWRMCDTGILIEAARHSGHELSIALGERLEDTADTEHLEQECAELEATCDRLRQRIETLEAQLATPEQESPEA